MLDKPLRADLGHDLVGAVVALAALKPERERQGIREIIGGCGREGVAIVCHKRRIAPGTCIE